jgi:hypothetical protein
MLGHFLDTLVDLAPAAESGGRFARNLKIPVSAGIGKSMPTGATSARSGRQETSVLSVELRGHLIMNDLSLRETS